MDKFWKVIAFIREAFVTVASWVAAAWMQLVDLIESMPDAALAVFLILLALALYF